MKKSLFIALFILISLNLFAQTNSISTNYTLTDSQVNIFNDVFKLFSDIFKTFGNSKLISQITNSWIGIIAIYSFLNKFVPDNYKNGKIASIINFFGHLALEHKDDLIKNSDNKSEEIKK